MTPPSERAIILFDGVCNLCNGFVNFVMDRDPDEVFRFAALQSQAAKTRLQVHGVTFDSDAQNTLLQSVILIENDQVYRRSTAALRIARHLAPPWPLLYGLIAVPAPIRDAIYDWIAAHRYAWFGQRDQCRVPTPDVRDRFLDDEAAG
jgi:predicted DCC family thiol-disulfide oxidoreductase YuxK